MHNWLIKFPRLNQLYERIGTSKPDNVLGSYIEWGKFDSNVQNAAKWHEDNLAQLDSTSWEDLKVKVSRHSKSCERRQFWNLLNEVRGYLLLADRGYSEINFIPETDEERADLIDTSPTRAILEVKTVNRSDDDIEIDKKRNDPTFSTRKKVGRHERPGDIIDLFTFANKLIQQTDPVSAFLWEQLDNPTQQLLANYVSDTRQVESKLVDHLNKIIEGQCIYEKERFRGVPLQSKTEYLLDSGEECFVHCLNRCLLDDAYPQELLNWSKSVDAVLILRPEDLPVPVPVKLLKKCEPIIEKARSQIETTLKNIPPVEKKIVLLIINRDFRCSPITMKQLEEKLQQPDLEVVCQVGDS